MANRNTVALPAEPAPPQENLNVRERSEYLGNLIYRQIFEDIKRGTYAPGDRLPTERRLMGQFAAARNTVRKAIARLVEDGLIQRQMGSGTYVATTSPAPNADDEAVSPLDVLEARMAVARLRRSAGRRATEADFARIQEQLDRLENARDQRTFREAGYAFHLEIARATRNPLIVRIFEPSSTPAPARLGQAAPPQRQPRGARAVASNRRVLAALRRRDTASARRLMRSHLWSMIADVAGPVGHD